MGLKFRAEFFPPMVKLLCLGDVRILIIEQLKIRFKRGEIPGLSAAV